MRGKMKKVTSLLKKLMVGNNEETFIVTYCKKSKYKL